MEHSDSESDLELHAVDPVHDGFSDEPSEMASEERDNGLGVDGYDVESGNDTDGAASALCQTTNWIPMIMLWMCVSQVLMELGQHLLLLWPMPLAVFPMTRSKPQSQPSSAE